MVRIVVLLLALLSIGAAPAATKPFQRIVLAPGCYVLTPGGTYDVSAYCLDESMPAPAPGTVLASAPESLGQTVIKFGGTITSLPTAMQRGLISLEGLGGGDYFHIRVHNLSPNRIEICVTSPTVLLGDEGYPTADLKKIYPQLTAILTGNGGSAPDSGNQELETHIKLQKQIWAAIDAAKAPADRRDGADWSPYDERAARAVSDGKDCTGPPDTVVLCTEH
jgi:hypothetical protein